MSGVGVPLQEVMLVLRVALLCSSDLPADHPTMRDVQMLSHVKPKSKGSSLAESHELMMASDLLLLKNDNLQLVCEQK
ncbi:unnamed protein product [Sphagnum jensenii]|uniref:Uncharacterized protein n=2 Tax=Sphagnum jensenii TaxID=128206 RepID=A0ABP1A0F7_9BRYO